jgi:septin family protein
MRDRYILDTRIHCCLYFINPTGHSLRPIDVIVMKKLSEVVNVVPVIAKADSLTLEERELFKEKVSVNPEEKRLVYSWFRHRIIDSGRTYTPKHPPLSV